MPSRSSFSAARMPSQVLAILIRIRFAVDPGFLVHADQLAGLGERPLGVEAEAGVDLGGDPARDDLEDLAGRRLTNSRSMNASAWAGVSPPCSAASVSACSTRWAYCGCWAAWKSSDGLVVASCGL